MKRGGTEARNCHPEKLSFSQERAASLGSFKGQRYILELNFHEGREVSPGDRTVIYDQELSVSSSLKIEWMPVSL